MSAPVTDRPRSAVRTAPARKAAPKRPVAPSIPAPRRGERAGERVADAARRAYARRDERTRRSTGAPRAAAAAAPRRAQFVLLVMGLLTTGLVLTLWLSTAASADSYRLQDAREQARTLEERTERLHREVAVLGSPTELARRAGELGMVAVDDPARLVAAPDGTVLVVGEPSVVPAPRPPATPTPGPPAAGVPAGGAPAGPGATPGAAPSGPTPDTAPSEGTADAALAAEDPAGTGGTDPAAAGAGVPDDAAAADAASGDPAADPAAADPAAADPAAADPGTG